MIEKFEGKDRDQDFKNWYSKNEDDGYGLWINETGRKEKGKKILSLHRAGVCHHLKKKDKPWPKEKWKTITNSKVTSSSNSLRELEKWAQDKGNEFHLKRCGHCKWQDYVDIDNTGETTI